MIIPPRTSNPDTIPASHVSRRTIKTLNLAEMVDRRVLQRRALPAFDEVEPSKEHHKCLLPD